MAILREGITVGNECVDQIRTSSKELTSISNSMISYLNGNANFQKFREGTDKGQSIYDNLDKCVKTINEQLVPAIEKMAIATSDLLNNQQNLNKADVRYDESRW